MPKGRLRFASLRSRLLLPARLRLVADRSVSAPALVFLSARTPGRAWPCVMFSSSLPLGPSPQFFLAGVFRDAELFEVMLGLVGDDLILQHQMMLRAAELHALAAGENLVAPVLLVPLGQRGGHVHFLDDVSPTHAGVVSAKGNLALLRGVRNDALLGPAKIVVEQILEPHARHE